MTDKQLSKISIRTSERFWFIYFLWGGDSRITEIWRWGQWFGGFSERVALTVGQVVHCDVMLLQKCNDRKHMRGGTGNRDVIWRKVVNFIHSCNAERVWNTVRQLNPVIYSSKVSVNKSVVSFHLLLTIICVFNKYYGRLGLYVEMTAAESHERSCTCCKSLSMV